MEEPDLLECVRCVVLTRGWSEVGGNPVVLRLICWHLSIEGGKHVSRLAHHHDVREALVTPTPNPTPSNPHPKRSTLIP